MKQWQAKTNQSNIYTQNEVSTSSYLTSEYSWRETILDENNDIIICGSLLMLTTFFTILRSFEFHTYCLKASSRLHNLMFDRIVYSKMSFFHKNPSGRILNRFSQDIGIMDEILPTTIMDVIEVGENIVHTFTIIKL